MFHLEGRAVPQAGRVGVVFVRVMGQFFAGTLAVRSWQVLRLHSKGDICFQIGGSNNFVLVDDDSEYNNKTNTTITAAAPAATTTTTTTTITFIAYWQPEG